jgi:hypothetical protein
LLIAQIDNDPARFDNDLLGAARDEIAVAGLLIHSQPSPQ